MSNQNRAALERLIKKGVALEKQLNEMIQTQLNRDGYAQYGDMASELLARRMRNVKENVEHLSFQFNFPTKNDIANLARLMIQLEEKMEKIEEQLAMLSASMERLQRKAQMQSHVKEKKKSISPLSQTKEGNVVLSMEPGLDSKVNQIGRWLSH